MERKRINLCTRPAFNLLYDRLGIQSLTCIAHFAGSPPTPKAQEHPEDPVTQMGSGPHVSHLTLPAWFPPCGSCDCLLSVPSPGQPRAREESILQLGTYRRDVHLSSEQSATKPGQNTPVKETPITPYKLRVVSDVCVHLFVYGVKYRTALIQFADTASSVLTDSQLET